jgi:hypothetical protein
MRVHSSSDRPTRDVRARIGIAIAAVLALAALVAGSSGVRSANAGSASVGRMLFLGDSVGASVAGRLPALLKKGGYAVTYEAKSARCTVNRTSPCRGGEAMDVLANVETPAFAVVELGYNDTPSSLTRGVEAVMTNLTQRGVQRVVWINMSERRPDGRGGSVYGASNQVLRNAAQKWPQLIVLDWNAASSGADATGWFVPRSKGKVDLIHLTPAGQIKFSEFVRRELDRLKGENLLPGNPGTPPSTSAPASTDPAPPATRSEVRRGDSGPAVLELQQELVRRGAKIVPDGKFGRRTEAAVKAFQRSNGLVADGRAGPRTWKALGI